MKVSAVLLVAFALIASVMCVEQECLPGEKHKEIPHPEPDLLACLAYKNKSCCSANFTKQLATPPVKKIGNFSWSPCNETLSPRCEAFMVNIECFYRCSHNTIYWENPDYPSSILKAPICASECNAWLEACKDDFTCARNWITDFNMSSFGENRCKEPCRKYSDVYSSGKDMCENLWGTSFEYQETADCLKLNITDPRDNDKVVDKLFGGYQTNSATEAPKVKGARGLCASLFLAITTLIIPLFV